jgi:hypothetical protein
MPFSKTIYSLFVTKEHAMLRQRNTAGVRHIVSEMRAKVPLRRFSPLIPVIGLAAALQCGTTAAATMSLTLQPGSYFDITIVEHSYFVSESSVGHTDLTGTLTVEFATNGAAPETVQIVSADISGTPTRMAFDYNPWLSMDFTPAHYSLVSPARQIAADGTFPVGGIEGIVDGGKMSTMFDLISFDFAENPLPFNFLPETGTATGNLRPGSPITLAIPVRFFDLTQNRIYSSNGQGSYVHGQGMIVASGTVPVPEPTSLAAASVLAVCLFAMTVARVRRRSESPAPVSSC